jgi:hypothetical protein
MPQNLFIGSASVASHFIVTHVISSYRKSCELTKATSPCDKKAVSHLELIQNIIEEWFKEREEEMKSRPCSVKPGIILCHMTIIQHNTDKISVEIN